ncbi:antibiotic biosynthesis monooxygenase [Variovorax sp. ZS18.2.2]|uniref:antibiotic biosynthesis monooxygenase family protein n=1 Tax=Variovorax sp. ZS18.2.2 TaxID=2971255 RepID=UPI0021508A5B|nr:antibiotic biosynthesis monooxygenase [Variovorax sp. ZS18.2.2]MCR6479526.1 antibiotic biosynthesis monooxygenase [Variovorax sp. ZS18.2.2]
MASSEPQVIEVVTLKVKAGVSLEAFREIDAAVGREHVAQQPGFISRESASSGESDWLVIVHWRSAEDADASMASFGNAAAAKPFMDSIDATSMHMKRYVRD